MPFDSFNTTLNLEQAPCRVVNAVELSAKSPSPLGRWVGVRGAESVATPHFDRPYPKTPPLGERVDLLNSTALCRVVGVAADELALLAGGLLPQFVEFVQGQGFAVEVDGVYPALLVVAVVDPAPVRGGRGGAVAERVVFMADGLAALVFLGD